MFFLVNLLLGVISVTGTFIIGMIIYCVIQLGIALNDPTDYKKLVVEHKRACSHHMGTDTSIRKGKGWEIFCKDGTIIIKE